MTDSSKLTAHDLAIPVYLNQRIVFDLIAVLEDGFASVTQVSETKSNSIAANREISSSFGLSDALATLLKVNVGGKREKSSSTDEQVTQTQARVHTPVSLFIHLRSSLIDKGILKPIRSDTVLAPGDLVEFSSVLKRNPVIEIFDAFIEFLDLAEAFSDTSPPPVKKHTKRSNPSSKSQTKTVRSQISSLLTSIKQGDTLDLTTPPLNLRHRAVISIETQYLNDPTMSDLVDGTFKVVAKVTRCLNDEKESISLNRKSAINRMPEEVISNLEEALKSSELAGISFPALEWEIQGPAIQVIPIAIFA